MAKHSDTVVTLRPLLSKYVEAHRVESSGVCAELDQLDALLADAVSRLTSSFETIGALSVRQRQLMFTDAGKSDSWVAPCLRKPPVANDEPNERAGVVVAPVLDAHSRDDLRALTEDIERHVQKAVTALQFQDIASQLLSHAVKRMDLLERMAGQIERLPDIAIEELNEALSLVRAEPGGNPVAQARMNEGTVELF